MAIRKLKSFAASIWLDTRGSVMTTELLLLSSIVVAGVLSSGNKIRTALNQQVGRMTNSISQPLIQETLRRDSAPATPTCLLLEE